MASSYTGRNRFTKQGTGDNADTWGSVLNSGVFDLVDSAISGVTTVSITTGTNVVLTTNNGSPDEARSMVLALSGAPTANIQVVVPNSEKVYMIDGSAFTGGNTVTVIGATGTGVDFTTGETGVVYCDGTNVLEIYKTPAAAAATTPLLRPGDLKNSAKTIDHDQWLNCNGRTLDSIANTEYADLYAAIGTAYGGTGASNFNIPDYRGRFHAGQDNMGGTSANILTNAAADSTGGSAGSEKVTPAGTLNIATHTLTAAEIPELSFSHSLTNMAAGGFTAMVPGSTTTTAVNAGSTPDAHGHSGSTFTGTEAEYVPPYLAGYVFILY